MKVRITHLKAPWPEGKGIGSLVEFKGDAVPEWAVGKCVHVEAEESAAKDDAKQDEKQKK